jgi:hypothetical protein
LHSQSNLFDHLFTAAGDGKARVFPSDETARQSGYIFEPFAFEYQRRTGAAMFARSGAVSYNAAILGQFLETQFNIRVRDIDSPFDVAGLKRSRVADIYHNHLIFALEQGVKRFNGNPFYVVALPRRRDR